MYDSKKRLLVKNSSNRYKIGSADKLKADADGSTTIYIQADSPQRQRVELAAGTEGAVLHADAHVSAED